MFRTLSRTLIRRIPSSPSAGSSRLLNHRRLSDRPASPLPSPEADPETDPAPPPPPQDPEPEASPAVHLRHLQDVIQAIVVRRSAPDWLPFVPGSSYWVPPMKPVPVISISEMLSNALSEEEVLSLTTVRGWPSSYYYLGEEGLPTHEVKDSPEEATDDEES